MTKKQNINIYVTPEVFEAVERKRGLVPRSTYVEHLLVDKLTEMGEIGNPGYK
jgi:hypothetical protein